MNDLFWRPYRPQMSFTTIGFDVTSSGGSLGGLMASLTFWRNDRYHGSSIWSTSRCDRWSSSGLNGLLGCDRSDILFHQPPLPGELLAHVLLHLMDDCSPFGVTGFGKSAPRVLNQECTTISFPTTCKNNNIRAGLVSPRQGGDSIIGIYPQMRQSDLRNRANSVRIDTDGN